MQPINSKHFANRALNARLVGFGFMLAFFSSFGQTFFIGLFGAAFRETFGLSSGSFGLIFSSATFISGFCLIWLGAAIDRLDLRIYSIAACLLLAVACLGLGTATHVAVFAVSLTLARLAGQGLLGHAAVTSMARYFLTRRGRAIGWATLGHHVGNGLFPAIVVMAIAAWGWRTPWLIAAAIMGLGVPLAILGLIGRHPLVAGPAQPTATASAQAPTPQTGAASAFRILRRDARFWLAVPSLFAPAFINTGIFFHQVAIAAEKGWPHALFAGAFVVYAVASASATMGAGYLVDALSARRLMPLYLLPLGVACTFLAFGDDPATIFVFMLLGGISNGLAPVVTTAMWAEVFGVGNLGSIRSIAAALMVFSTAAAPGAIGILFDIGIPIADFLIVSALFVAGCAVSAGYGFGWHTDKPLKSD